MNNINKLLATAMTVAVAGTTLPLTALAAGDVPSDTKTVGVTINNVIGAEKITAYRVVEPEYNAEGFVNFKKVNGVVIADIESPTGKEVTQIAKDIIGGSLVPAKTVDFTVEGNTASGNLPAGEYVVLVTDVEDANYMFNPMVVSAYYTDANDENTLTSAAALDAAKASEFYAKRFEIPLDKEITDADGITIGDDDSMEGSQADDLGVGDTAKFTIRTVFPQYSEAYQANGVTYILEDTQDAGFDAPENIMVAVGGNITTASSSTYTSVINGNDFSLEFDSAFVLANAGKDVIVTYESVLNDDAAQKFDPNSNTVKLTYTNSVTDRSKVTQKEDNVQEYTFPIEIKKIAAIDGKDTNGGQPIEGAEFTLKRTDSNGKTGVNSLTVKTDRNGIAEFPRLDEGTYEVIETKAPAGYAINPNVFEVKIVPEYNTDGSLKQYQVIMKDITAGKDVGSIVVDSADDAILAGNITDSRLQALPATGGNGTKLALWFAGGFGVITLTLIAFGKKKEKEQV